MKTAIKYLLFTVAIAPMWLAAPAKADVVYHNPRVAGAILDHCWTWGANCGRARANWWCRRRGHQRARSYSLWRPGRTFVVGNGRYCNGGICTGYRRIRCVQRVAVVCGAIFRPVCGWRVNRWVTYSNRCVARRAGAIAIRSRACVAAGCPNINNPVCGWRVNRWATFRNVCRARRAGATRLRRGRCAAGWCSFVRRPVCAWRRSTRTWFTFRNSCWARRAGAISLRPGSCPGGAGFRACWVRNAQINVSSRGCGGQTARINFGVRRLRNGATVRRAVKTGVITRGAPPYGVCNFHTDLVYRCVNGRLRIVRWLQCVQNRSGRVGASCRVTN